MPSAARSSAARGGWRATAPGRSAGQTSPVEPAGVDVPVDGVEEPVHPVVGVADRVGPGRRRSSPGAVCAHEVPGQPDARGPAAMPRSSSGPGRGRCARPTSCIDGSRRAPRVAHLVDRARRAAGALEPPVDVHAAVAARHPVVPADGQDDLATRGGELVGDLDAGGRRPDDEHAARRGAAAGCGSRPRWSGGRRGRALERTRDARPPAGPGRHDDVASQPGRAVGDDAVAARGRQTHILHAHTGEDGALKLAAYPSR